jgi:hypothetical protein
MAPAANRICLLIFVGKLCDDMSTVVPHACDADGRFWMVGADVASGMRGVVESSRKTA